MQRFGSDGLSDCVVYGKSSASSAKARPQTMQRSTNPNLERLVKDRFPDFQNLYKDHLANLPKATTPANESMSALRHKVAEYKDKALSSVGIATPTPAGDNRPAPDFMRPFFDRIAECQSSITAGREALKSFDGIHEEALLATTQAREQEASRKLNELVSEVNDHIGKSKRILESLKQEEAGNNPDSAEAKIRANMMRVMAKKQQQLLMDFQKIQSEFKNSWKKRQNRELAALMPDSTEEERACMIAQGETAGLIVAQRMVGAHALLLDEVDRIKAKHQDIQRLEASITDLAQMFQEMAVLVDAQGEMLDGIECHVHKSKVCQQKAVEELKSARKHQEGKKKWMWCLTMFMLMLLLAILFPIIVSQAA